MLAAEIISILTDLGMDAFSGFYGKFKLYRIKKKLHSNLHKEIFLRYGDEVYYHDLDCFLSKNKVIYNIIINCESTFAHQHKPRTQIIQYYVQLFIESKPRFLRYQSEIYSIIQKCFDVIFNTLNNINATESVRVISNIAKELAGELSLEIKSLRLDVAEINKRLVNQQILDNANHNAKPVFYHEKYFEYLIRIYIMHTNSAYIPRSLFYENDSNNDVDSFEALLNERHILLLGEAGSGKTYESIALLNKACTSQKAADYLPVYLSLNEYGIVYSNIIDGIKYKIAPFCDGDPYEFISSWLSEGKVVLILDGIDDILTEELRLCFVSEAKNIAVLYNHCYLFITSRFNRYHGELGNIKKYYIRCLSKKTIRKQLLDESINVEIPDSYYQLFGNPLFLEVGKIVLKNSPHRDIFNRSILFEELVFLLCGEWDKRKGISSKYSLSYSDAVGILGQYAFDKFYQPSTRHIEFEEYISKISPSNTNKTAIIDFLLSSELLRVSNGIVFTHKLFKEFFAACYLVSRYPLSDYRSMYLEYINKEEWKEVFIFASGLYKNIEEQDRYLDFIMHNNLQLYIECINAKSDLSVQLVLPNNLDVAKRYLEQIVKTYMTIVHKFFEPIAFQFDPIPGKAEKNINEKKTQIVGSLSPDGNYLSYWFNRVMPDEPDVLCIYEDQIVENYKEREKQAVFERKKIISYGINLNLSGLQGDSGRKIAVNLIKEQIKEIIKEKRLAESYYLLCERVNNCKEKIKELRDVSDIAQMRAIVEGMIHKIKEISNNVESYSYSGVEIFDLFLLLKYLDERSINFCDYILPANDIDPKEPPYWIWNFYSEEQMANRLSKFFYFHQLSYIEMVEKNFPVLCNMFPRYLDTPYQNVVIIDYKKGERPNGSKAEPSLFYYYIASPNNYPIPPKLIYVDNEVNRKELVDDIYENIKQSYLKRGKTAQYLGWTNAGLSFTLISRRTGVNSPLSDYVYECIKTSLEQVLGKL